MFAQDERFYGRRTDIKAASQVKAEAQGVELRLVDELKSVPSTVEPASK